MELRRRRPNCIQEETQNREEEEEPPLRPTVRSHFLSGSTLQGSGKGFVECLLQVLLAGG